MGTPLWLVGIICVPLLGYIVLFPRSYQLSTERNVAVVQVLGPYRFTFRPVNADNSLAGTRDDEFTHDICQDYTAPGSDFAEGTILNRLIHTEEPGCWSLNPYKHCGWFKRRDVEKNPVYVKGGALLYGN